MLPMFDKYLDYITKVGDNCFVDWFDDDWEPIGPQIRMAMVNAGLVEEVTDGARPYLRRI